MMQSILEWLTLRNLLAPRDPYAGKEPVFLCSYPKSGRTWLRFILANYLNEAYRLDLDIDLQSVFQIIPNLGRERRRGLGVYRFADREEVPMLVCSHASYTADVFGGHRTIFLLRSVYDVLVSHYFHLARQRQRYDSEITAFIRDPDRGVHSYVGYVNSWAPHLTPSTSVVLTYEALSASTRGEVRKALDFVGVECVPSLLEASLASATFHNMRKLEVEKGIAGHSYDAGDEDALRVRRGVVGGYVDYLAPEDEAYIRDTCHRHLSRESLALLDRLDLMP